MPLSDKPTQWTVTLSPAPTMAGPPLWRTTARRWLLTGLALLAAYWIGTANADGNTGPATSPRPAYTQPATVTIQPDRSP